MGVDDDGGGRLEIGVHVIDDGFHVVGGLFELPESLVGAGFVLECEDDK